MFYSLFSSSKYDPAVVLTTVYSVCRSVLIQLQFHHVCSAFIRLYFLFFRSALVQLQFHHVRPAFPVNGIITIPEFLQYLIRCLKIIADMFRPVPVRSYR